MTEDEAKGWIADRFGDAAVDRVAQMLARIIEENGRQNLIAPSTVEQIWGRHALDSAQLVPLGCEDGTWLDIGTGGGFPGLIVSALRRTPVVLVEPRRKRAEFLTTMVEAFGLSETRVAAVGVERVTVEARVISARAVASIGKILAAARQCATEATRWILPRGRLESADMAALRTAWGGMFHVEQSVTDAASSIVIADGVHAR